MDDLPHKYCYSYIMCLHFNEHMQCFVVLFLHSSKLVQGSKKKNP